LRRLAHRARRCIRFRARDLFVVRVAGNFANDDMIAGLEYGVAMLNVPLIMVLGHGSCGAVDATVKPSRTARNTGICRPRQRVTPAVRLFSAPVICSPTPSKERRPPAARCRPQPRTAVEKAASLVRSTTWRQAVGLVWEEIDAMSKRWRSVVELMKIDGS
jgi:carbonic anhydrase